MAKIQEPARDDFLNSQQLGNVTENMRMGAGFQHQGSRSDCGKRGV